MLEFVGKTFTIMSESWRIVTSDVGFQTPSTRTTKIVSIVSSSPVETVPQEDKTMQELKQTLDHKSEEVPLAIGRGCGDRDFSSEEEDDQNRTVFSESRGNFFLEKRYDSIHRGEIPEAPWADRFHSTTGPGPSQSGHQFVKRCQHNPRRNVPYIGTN
ncbi:hypothetical protein F2Q69_00033633 [Brassica cretica]|uniref:Uncharacterized protein n=1 Tax=Brassica cretica TaxID=69181 RepID=A0A8S9SP75_BRACR|nr:hypothetical protein F2Q69_00033633 [Brassica cretica]